MVKSVKIHNIGGAWYYCATMILHLSQCSRCLNCLSGTSSAKGTRGIVLLGTPIFNLIVKNKLFWLSENHSLVQQGLMPLPTWTTIVISDAIFFNFNFLESSYSIMSTMKQYQKKFTISFCEMQRQVQSHESAF